MQRPTRESFSHRLNLSHRRQQLDLGVGFCAHGHKHITVLLNRPMLFLHLTRNNGSFPRSIAYYNRFTMKPRGSSRALSPTWPYVWKKLYVPSTGLTRHVQFDPCMCVCVCASWRDGPTYPCEHVEKQHFIDKIKPSRGLSSAFLSTMIPMLTKLKRAGIPLSGRKRLDRSWTSQLTTSKPHHPSLPK